MRLLTTLFCALVMLASVHATQTDTIVAADYSVRADVANNAVFYSLQEANQGRSFNFYIYIAEGKHDIESGQTYTMSDMEPYYCYWQEDAISAYSIAEASFVKTKGDGYSVNITAHVVDAEGEVFDIIYQEEPLVLTGDTVRVTFDKPAQIERNNNGTWSISGGNSAIGARVQYYSTDDKSCAGSFAGEEVYLPACHIDVATGEYEYGLPLFDRVIAKDATVQVAESDQRIEAHATMVGGNGVVYVFTMQFDKPGIVDSVIITSDSLLIETWGYSQFGTIQLSAADSAYKVIFWFEPYGLDSLIAGTYVVGERQFDGWVIDLATKAESGLYSGSVTISYDDGAYSVDGAVLCKNNVEYTLHLSLPKPAPTREQTLVFARVPMSVNEQDGWGAYGESESHTEFISIMAPTTSVAGKYTEKELIAEYTFVGTNLAPDGSTNTYFRLVTADLDVTFNDVDSVAHITGTMFCISALDPNDRPLFTIDVTTAMDGPFFYDESGDFSAEFETYEVNDLMVEDLGVLLAEAYNEEDGAFVALQIFVPEGADQLTAGVYPIRADETPQTTLASRGLYGGYATYSIAGYANEHKQFERIWFIVSGNVTVSDEGAIVVEALNSNGGTVRCQLNRRTEAIENVADDKEQHISGRKVIREGSLIIEQNGKIYNAQGILIK